jgi:hypothetical protein
VSSEKRVKKRKDGEWFPISKRGHRIVCCDCRLEHFIQVRITPKGRISMAAWRTSDVAK